MATIKKEKAFNTGCILYWNADVNPPIYRFKQKIRTSILSKTKTDIAIETPDQNVASNTALVLNFINENFIIELMENKAHLIKISLLMRNFSLKLVKLFAAIPLDNYQLIKSVAIGFISENVLPHISQYNITTISSDFDKYHREFFDKLNTILNELKIVDTIPSDNAVSIINFTRRPVATFMEEANCSSCGIGTYIYDNEVVDSDNMFNHVCNRCLTEVKFPNVYPIISYE